MKLAVVMATMREGMWKESAVMLREQTRQPDLLVIVRHCINHPAEPFRQLSVPLLDLFGAADRLTGDLQNFGVDRAVSAGMDWVAVMDDDDWYGPLYLAELERAIAEDPDAWLMGKASFWTEWMDSQRHWEPFEAAVSGNGLCRSVAGSTISINLSRWRQFPTMRFPSASIADSGFIHKAMETWAATQMTPAEWPPFRSTSMDNYRVRRYLDFRHHHSWMDPRDHRS